MALIALSGYYGFHNIGDEAILEAVVNALRHHRPDVKMVVFSADPRHTRRAYGVEAVSRTNLPAIIRVLRKADLLISGGGGLLQDATGPRSIPYYLGIIRLAMLLQTKVAVYAQGLGPLRSGRSRFWVKKVLSGVDWLSVRDHASARLLAELGVKRDITVTADPVFFLDPEPRKEVETYWKAYGIKRPGKELLVGLALRPYPGETLFDRKLLEIVSDGCRFLEKEYNARLIFLPYHLKKDLPLARDLASRSSTGGIVIEESLSSRDILRVMGGLDLLIGMRLHSLIFASICGVPFIALPYDPKVNAFLQYVEKPGLSLESLNLVQLQESIKSALDEGEEAREYLRIKINAQKKEVQGAAQKILSLL